MESARLTDIMQWQEILLLFWWQHKKTLACSWSMWIEQSKPCKKCEKSTRQYLHSLASWNKSQCNVLTDSGKDQTTGTNMLTRRERSTRGLGCPDDTGHRDVTSCKARDFVQFRKWRWWFCCIKRLFFPARLRMAFGFFLNRFLIFFSRYR